MRVFTTRAWILLDNRGNQPSLVPLVRFAISEGCEQLRRGYDGAVPENAPHEWHPMHCPIDQSIKDAA